MRGAAGLLLVLCACQHEAPPVAAPAPPPIPRAALPQDVTLPTSSTASGAAGAQAVRVYVGRRELAMGEPPRVVAAVPAEASHGFDEALKRNGKNDLYVNPIAAAAPKGVPTAAIYFDRDTPYRLFTEVLFTLGQSEIGHYQLLTTTGALEVDAPKGDYVKRMAEPHLGLTVIVLTEGISVKTRGGNIAPGCKGPGEGIAIPRKSEQQDFGAFTECLARLRAGAPEFANEKDVLITAQPAIPVQQVIATIDAAARGTFSVVTFGISR